jgi:hypothetical protein
MLFAFSVLRIIVTETCLVLTHYRLKNTSERIHSRQPNIVAGPYSLRIIQIITLAIRAPHDQAIKNTPICLPPT